MTQPRVSVSHAPAARPHDTAASEALDGALSHRSAGDDPAASRQDSPAPFARAYAATLRALPQMTSATLDALDAGAEALAATAKRWDGGAQAALARLLEQRRALAETQRIIEELRELSAPDARLLATPVELDDALMALLSEWKARAPRHTFELALPGEAPPVPGDARWMTRALDLLLDLAVRLTPTGYDAPAEESVRAQVRATGDAVAVSVWPGRVTGRAPVRAPARLFEPFFTPPDAPEGFVASAGPALARAIVEAHGGRLLAEQDPAGGLVFRSLWPLTQPSRVATQPAPALTSPAPAPAQPIRQAPARSVALVLESEPRMARYLRANLEARGFQALVATDLTDAIRLIELEEPDAVLLDTRFSGSEAGPALQRLRAAAGVGVPILLLAAQRDPVECARLLDAGAADYIAKPFDVEELLARLRVALRASQATRERAERERVLVNGDLRIDLAQRAVTIAGRPIALSKTEFKLLRALAEHAGMALTHEALLERVWGPGYSGEVEFVWVYIRRLRKKIEADPAKPRYILTAPGVGYRLARL